MLRFKAFDTIPAAISPPTYKSMAEIEPNNFRTSAEDRVPFSHLFPDPLNVLIPSRHESEDIPQLFALMQVCFLAVRIMRKFVFVMGRVTQPYLTPTSNLKIARNLTAANSMTANLNFTKKQP